MRIIKFRAWNKINSTPKERMMYSIVINQRGEVCMPNGDWWNIPVMQFIGKKDKNGKEIYEGDILGNYFVKWSDFKAAFILAAPESELTCRWVHQMEVRGNIYEDLNK